MEGGRATALSSRGVALTRHGGQASSILGSCRLRAARSQPQLRATADPEPELRKRMVSCHVLLHSLKRGHGA